MVCLSGHNRPGARVLAVQAQTALPATLDTKKGGGSVRTRRLANPVGLGRLSQLLELLASGQPPQPLLLELARLGERDPEL